MKNKLLKVFLVVLLMIWPYLFYFASYIPEEYNSYFLYGYGIGTVLVYLGNIILSFTYKGENKVYNLARVNVLLKLVHIPFYLIVFCITVVFLLCMVVPAFVFLSPMIVLYLFIVDVCLLLTTSFYGFNAIHNARKEKEITGKQSLFYMIMHCLFVCDVIFSLKFLNLVKKNHKEKKVTNEIQEEQKINVETKPL